MSALTTDARIAVIGAGAMGAGIAQVAAQAGHQVQLLDSRPGAAAQAIAGIDRQLGKRVQNGKLEAQAHRATLDRLQVAESIDSLADSDLIIEAIVENLEVKQQLFRQLESLCQPSCILASNTSSLSITSIAAGLTRPERLLGLHFFNPAPVMALVEVISGLASDPALARCLYDTAAAWGKNRCMPDPRRALSSTAWPGRFMPRACACCRKAPPIAPPSMLCCAKAAASPWAPSSSPT